MADGQMTDQGRAEREAVEEATDAACGPIVRNLGDDVDELVRVLRGWSSAVQAGSGYPSSGPLDLASAASRSS
jgi:hypothetical protein